MSHCDSSSFLGTVTPPPDPPHQPWSRSPISSPAVSGPQAHPFPTLVPRLQEDTAAALQRLVELTAPRVTPVRSLRAQYRLIRKLGSGSYGQVLLARPRQGGEYGHRKAAPGTPHRRVLRSPPRRGTPRGEQLGALLSGTLQSSEEQSLPREDKELA